MEWIREWDRAVRERDVAVVYDAGFYERAQARARDLEAHGAFHAWAVDLASAGLADGEDLTDGFVSGRDAAELRRLIKRCGGES
jgi:hypothetical protein